MRSLQVSAKVDAIDTGVVADQGVIRCRLGRSYGPNLDCLVKGGCCKHGWVFGVDLNLHDIVLMVPKRVNFRPILVPVEHHNGIVVGAGKHIWL